jgi:hypothetical protein
MSHWMFVTAAYAVTLLGTGGITVWSLVAMRRAEAAADALRSRK